MPGLSKGHIIAHAVLWKHVTVLWVGAVLVVLLCLSIGSVWAPTPTLPCLALAHPWPHSHRSAQHHWAAADGTCLGMLLKESRGCFSLSMRLIHKIFICSSKCQVSGHDLLFRRFWRLCCSPLAIDVGYSPELPSTAAGPDMGTPENPRHQPMFKHCR